MKKLIVCILFAKILFLIGCNTGNISTPFDPSVQVTIDSTIIADYFLEQGYPIDDESISENGVRFVILDEGSGEKIDESDNVAFNYVGFLLNDTIFDTTIDEIADSIRIEVEESIVNRGDTTNLEAWLINKFSSENSPFEITYTQSGWTFNDRFISGFSEGIRFTFDKMGINGRALIFLPSHLAYGFNGNLPLIGSNEVIAFELIPVEIFKQ